MPVMGSPGAGRRQRSNSVGRLEVPGERPGGQGPRRTQSFRSCLKKEPTVDAELLQLESGNSSRKSSGSRAVMFSDEIGEELVIVNKFDTTDPVVGQAVKEKKLQAPVRNEVFAATLSEKARRREQENSGYDTDEDTEDLDLDHYRDDPRLKIFGNPTVRKTQSFCHKRGPVQRTENRNMNTPSNTPHSNSPSSSSPHGSPVTSPTLNPRQKAVALALQQRGLVKSESCAGMVAGGNRRSDSPMVLSFKRPELAIPGRPTIVLTSAQEGVEQGINIFGGSQESLPSPQFSLDSPVLELNFTKLSQSVIREGLEEYAMGRQDVRNKENEFIKTLIAVEGLEGSMSQPNRNIEEKPFHPFLVTKEAEGSKRQQDQSMDEESNNLLIDAQQFEGSRRHQDQSMEEESSTSPIVKEKADCSENQQQGMIKEESLDHPTARERCGGSRRQHDPSTPTTQRAKKKILVNTGSLPPPPKTAPPPLPLQIL